MRNHVIPKSVVKRFADDSGRIWFYRKTNQDGALDIRHVGWAKIFVRKGIYDDQTEDRLQKLDGKAARIMNRIEHEGPQNVELDAIDKLTLCEFLGIQLLRSEKSIHEMTCDEYIDGYVRKTYTVTRPSREEFHEGVLQFIGHMINGGMRSWVNPKIPEYGQLTFKNIHTIAIPDTLDVSFIVGDSIPILYSREVSKLDYPYSNELVNPNSIKVMPITPKIAIVLCRENVFENTPVDILVEAINISMFNECLGVAAYAKDTIQSLLSNSHTRKTHEETLEAPTIGFCIDG